MVTIKSLNSSHQNTRFWTSNLQILKNTQIIASSPINRSGSKMFSSNQLKLGFDFSLQITFLLQKSIRVLQNLNFLFGIVQTLIVVDKSLQLLSNGITLNLRSTDLKSQLCVLSQNISCQIQFWNISLRSNKIQRTSPNRLSISLKINLWSSHINIGDSPVKIRNFLEITLKLSQIRIINFWIQTLNFQFSG